MTGGGLSILCCLALLPLLPAAREPRGVPATGTRDVPATGTRDVPATDTRDVPATGTRGVPSTCTRAIPAGLLGELWRKTKDLIDYLPNQDSRASRLLPVYPKGPLWSDVGRVMSLYDTKVFRKDVITKLLPPHFNELLNRLMNTLHSCAAPQKRSKTVHRYEKRIKKLFRKRGDKVYFKAVREFLFVLQWIQELR